MLWPKSLHRIPKGFRDIYHLPKEDEDKLNEWYVSREVVLIAIVKVNEVGDEDALIELNAKYDKANEAPFGRHACMIIDYGCENGVRFIVLRNSHGEDYGYVKVAIDHSHRLSSHSE